MQIQHQITKEYYKEYMAATEPMFVQPREVKILKRLAPFYMAKDH